MKKIQIIIITLIIKERVFESIVMAFSFGFKRLLQKMLHILKPYLI